MNSGPDLPSIKAITRFVCLRFFSKLRVEEPDEPCPVAELDDADKARYGKLGGRAANRACVCCRACGRGFAQHMSALGQATWFKKKAVHLGRRYCER